MGTLEQYWRKAAAGIDRAFGQKSVDQSRAEELERELLALAAENQTLGGKLERVRADAERCGSEALQKVHALEQAQQQTDTTRLEHADRLTELVQRVGELQAGLAELRDRAAALEAALTETARRLDTRAGQLKFLQDSAREQIQAVKTAVAEASSRLESRDNTLERAQESAREQMAMLEGSLRETLERIEATHSEIGTLRVSAEKRAEQLESRLSSGVARLDAADNRIKVLEKKLEVEHKLQQNLLEDMRAHWRKQDEGLRRARLVSVATLLLAVAAGVFLWSAVG